MSKQINRSKTSLLNAISALMLTMVNGLMGIVVTRFIIAEFGSDFNGLNSTANQIVNVLLIMEGGFTLASNVALFAPLTVGDIRVVNGILTATRSKFQKIGGLFLGIGTGIAVAYSFVVNSTLPTEFVFTLVFMTVVPAAFNLFYATTYRVLLQTQQKEYVISLITMLAIGLGHGANIVMILLGGPMWAVRCITMIFALINSFLIAWYTKRKNPYIDFKETPRPELIKGTGDVMAQKITGVIYNSAPIVFLSISPAGGTALASVYAVYNNVFTMMKSLLHGVIDAPRLGFGQMLTERKREEVWPTFALYEYIAFFAVYLLMSTACVLILPFVGLYTYGVTDANYYDPLIAVLMVLISSMEMLHIPSGHLINMAGEFRISKNFQIISCVVLVLGMLIGGSVWGVHGMLAALLIVAILLCILEMGYVHLFFFKGKILALLRLGVPLGIVGAIVCWLEMQLPLTIQSYMMFIVYGVLFVTVNGIIGLIVGCLFNRRELKAVIVRVMNILKR